jgi:iron complex outermembrane receptor protein
MAARVLRIPFVALSVVSAGVPAALLAPSARAADDGQVLEQIVVTATQTPTAVLSAPAAVSVVTGDDISERNVSRFSDAMTLVPGFYGNQDANGLMSSMTGSGSFTLRGMNGTRTAMLIDGVPLADSYGNVDFRTVLPEEVQRIEIVPGAFSSLYGSNAIGGVVNVITKEPDEREDVLRVKKGWRDAMGEDADFYYRNKFDDFGIVFGYGYQHRDGYANDFVEVGPLVPGTGTPVTGAVLTNANNGTPTYIIGDQGAEPWHQINSVLRATYDLTPRDRLHAGVAFNDFRMSYAPYDTYLRDAAGNPAGNSGAAPSGTYSFGGNQFFVADWMFATVAPAGQGDLRLDAGYDGIVANDWKLKVEVAHSKKSNDYSSIDFTALFSFNPSVAVGDWAGGPGVLNSSPSTTTDALAQITMPVGSLQTVVAGLNLHNTALEQTVWNATDWRDPATKTRAQSGSIGNSGSWAIYAQDEIKLVDAWKVYAGGRLDRWSTEGSNFQVGTVANGGAAYDNVFSARSVSAFSPKFSSVWNPTPDTAVRASVGRSFRAPDNYELYGTVYCCNSFYYANPKLRPETATSWELGGDWHPTRALTATVSLYQTTLKNMIYSQVVTAVNPFGGSNYQQENAEEARVRGVELALGWAPLSWLDLRASYSHIDDEVLENPGDLTTVGNHLAATPTNMAAGALRVHSGSWSGLIEAKYTGKTFSSEQNIEVASGVFGVWDDVTIVNLKAGYRVSAALQVNLAVNNLGNVTAYEYYLMPRRTYTAEAVLSF